MTMDINFTYYIKVLTVPLARLEILVHQDYKVAKVLVALEDLEDKKETREL